MADMEHKTNIHTSLSQMTKTVTVTASDTAGSRLLNYADINTLSMHANHSKHSTK